MERLDGFNKAVQEVIRRTVEQHGGACYVRVAQAKGTDGYAECAHAVTD